MTKTNQTNPGQIWGSALIELSSTEYPGASLIVSDYGRFINIFFHSNSVHKYIQTLPSSYFQVSWHPHHQAHIQIDLSVRCGVGIWGLHTWLEIWCLFLLFLLFILFLSPFQCSGFLTHTPYQTAGHTLGVEDLSLNMIWTSCHIH